MDETLWRDDSQGRKNPALLNASRRKRIAAGSGTTVAGLNTMLNQFFPMQQMMKKMGKMQKMMSRMGGGMPGDVREAVKSALQNGPGLAVSARTWPCIPSFQLPLTRR